MEIGAVILLCGRDSSRIGAWGACNAPRPAFRLPRYSHSTLFEGKAQGKILFLLKEFALNWTIIP